MRMARATVESVRASLPRSRSARTLSGVLRDKSSVHRLSFVRVHAQWTHLARIDYEAIFAAAREKAEAEKRAKKEQRAKRKKQRKEAAAEAPLETKAGDEDPMAALMGFSSFKSGAPKAK